MSCPATHSKTVLQVLGATLMVCDRSFLDHTPIRRAANLKE